MLRIKNLASRHLLSQIPPFVPLGNRSQAVETTHRTPYAVSTIHERRLARVYNAAPPLLHTQARPIHNSCTNGQSFAPGPLGAVSRRAFTLLFEKLA